MILANKNNTLWNEVEYIVLYCINNITHNRSNDGLGTHTIYEYKMWVCESEKMGLKFRFESSPVGFLSQLRW